MRALHDLANERDAAAKACLASLDQWTGRIAKDWKKPVQPKVSAQRKRLEQLDPLAQACRDLVKDVDLVCKLAGRVVDTAEKDANAREHEQWDSRAVGRLEKDLDERRKELVEQLKRTAYFERQAHWLLSRFPEAKFVPVAGLCRAVVLQEIEAADWSLTPGRYVGVARWHSRPRFRRTLKGWGYDQEGATYQMAGGKAGRLSVLSTRIRHYVSTATARGAPGHCDRDSAISVRDAWACVDDRLERHVRCRGISDHAGGLKDATSRLEADGEVSSCTSTIRDIANFRRRDLPCRSAIAKPLLSEPQASRRPRPTASTVNVWGNLGVSEIVLVTSSNLEVR